MSGHPRAVVCMEACPTVGSAIVRCNSSSHTGADSPETAALVRTYIFWTHAHTTWSARDKADVPSCSVYSARATFALKTGQCRRAPKNDVNALFSKSNGAIRQHKGERNRGRNRSSSVVDTGHAVPPTFARQALGYSLRTSCRPAAARSATGIRSSVVCTLARTLIP